MKKLFIIILAMMMAVGMTLPATAVGDFCPTLPTGTIGVTWEQSSPHNPGYFLVLLSGAGSLDGTYDGWCIDIDHGYPPGAPPYPAKLYCSYGSLPVGAVDVPANIDSANWLLNQNLIGQPAIYGGSGTYTWQDIQIALWTLLEDSNLTAEKNALTPNFSQVRVDGLVQAALTTGNNFEPNAGELCIVVIVPMDVEDRINGQVHIITLVAQAPPGDEGCTPGYWKGNADNWNHSAWVGHLPGESFSSIFGRTITIFNGGNPKNLANYKTSPTLREALDANGSGINLLARSAVAALLNASNPSINYPLTVPQIILAVQNAIDNHTEGALGAQLDDYNNLGCPIDQHWALVD